MNFYKTVVYYKTVVPTGLLFKFLFVFYKTVVCYYKTVVPTGLLFKFLFVFLFCI